jgi:hypothetical protein
VLAVFQDVAIELEELRGEVGRLERKSELYKAAKTGGDVEIADSHMRAMASFIHDIYTGIEKLLEGLVKYFDGQLPVGEEWHRKLLARASSPNEPARPAIISSDVSAILDDLRSFRHVFRNRYLSNLIPKRVDDLADETVRAFRTLDADIQRFIATFDSRTC